MTTNIFIKFGFWIEGQKYLYKEYGLKTYLKHNYFLIKICVFRYIYKNNKKYRLRVINNLCGGSLFNFYALEWLVTGEMKTLMEYYDSLSMPEQVKFREEINDRKEEIFQNFDKNPIFDERTIWFIKSLLY